MPFTDEELEALQRGINKGRARRAERKARLDKLSADPNTAGDSIGGATIIDFNRARAVYGLNNLKLK